MKALFVGHFAPLRFGSWPAEVGSIAGNQVQREIINELSLNEAVSATEAISLRPLASWPKARAFVPKAREEGIVFPAFLNLPVLKNLLFSIALFRSLLRARPEVVIAYNSYVFENIAVLLYVKLAGGRTRTAIILQDVHTDGASLRGRIRGVYERVGLRLARYFNLAAPVTRHIVADFGLNRSRCLIFPGGATDAARVVSQRSVSLRDIAVFAGALTPYNGVDVLVEEWIRQGIPHDLHIFGRGALDDELRKLAQGQDNIHIHGLVPEQDVARWLARARWNFCFRLSRGIDQRYFFPSKFFTLACAPGAMITNESFEAPPDLKRFTHVISDDAHDLLHQLHLARESCDEAAATNRKVHVLTYYTWKRAIASILDELRAE